MRPNKPINPGAHRSGTADRTSKGRYSVAGLPEAPPEPTGVPPEQPAPETAPASKYVGRASVRAWARDEEEIAGEAAPAEWVDPLDGDEIDLTEITIDLRPSMIDEPPDTYYQRFSSRVPGHQ
jgi:hypothetical protein